jgi:hypothetical protein
MTADLDPRDLAEVRRRVVDPVVAGLLGPDEFDDVVLEIGPQRLLDTDDAAELLTIQIRACGELVTWWSSLLPEDGGAWDAEDGAAELYDHLRDDLTESRFGWGQLRDGDYEVPGPLPPE